MEDVLRNPTAPGNEDKIKTAFGPSGIKNTDELLRNVGLIKAANVPILTPDKTQFVDKKTGGPRLAGAIYHDEDDSGSGAIKTEGANGNLFKHVELGSTFYDHPMVKKEDRAGTLIHEAAHWAAYSGDHVTKDKYVLNSEQLRNSAAGDKKNGGCELIPFFSLMLSGYAFI